MPIIRLLISLFFLCSAATMVAAADPAYFRVTGVAASDVLNIRAEPNASSQQIGSFEPDAGPIEVLEVRDVNGRDWGRVHFFESDGWVSMRYLALVDVAYVASTKLPLGLSCGGTEPFWNLVFKESGIELSQMGTQLGTLSLQLATTARGRNHRFAIVAADQGRRMTAFVSRGEQCSDGMSDRNYGWRIDVLIEDPDNTDLAGSYEGCCRLPLQ
ncbi:MAG: SH3 domain-containing protein [Pseudomonadota bacterium]